MVRTIGVGCAVAVVSMVACSRRAADRSLPDSGPVLIVDASAPEPGPDHPADQAGTREASHDTDDDRPVDASSTDGADREVDAQRPDAVPAAPIWTDDSTAIDVLCSGHHEGQMRFRARRDQLSTDQLALLANVTTAPPQPGPPTPDACVPDVLGCTVTISGAGGASVSYFVYGLDYPCGGHDNLIADSTFGPFRASLPCRYGLEVGPGSPPLRPLAPDERCFHGLVPSSLFPEPVLAVDAPGRSRHVELDGCLVPGSAASLLMQIRTEDGASTVADGAPVAEPGADHVCLGLDHTFVSAGNYRLHVAPVADAGFPGPWLFYRFY
ncbi:MAG TPA: hypothetical protein VFH68_21030 [Polyangia bacterium]|jgi:hypothetical protein|nr:hypothetical protein [Polyangia bacterium]